MIRLLFIFCLSLCSWSAHAAGGASTGGAQGFVCHGDDGTISSAQLLDLVEATDYWNLKMLDQGGKSYLEIAHDLATILDGAIPYSIPMVPWSESSATTSFSGYDINAGFVAGHLGSVDKIRFSVKDIDTRKMLVPGDSTLPPVGDSTPLVLPSKKGCYLEQIAVYVDDLNQVHIRQAVWDKLSNLDKAGLLIHEALYQNNRWLGDKTSDRTRKTVGYLFSGLGFAWVFDGVPEKFLSCWSVEKKPSLQFIVFPKNEKDVTLRLLVHDGSPVLTKIEVSESLIPFAKSFGLTMPVGAPFGMGQVIEAPLLDTPYFSFEFESDNSGILAMKVETGPAMDENALRVQCNPQLTKVVVIGDSGVGITHVDP